MPRPDQDDIETARLLLLHECRQQGSAVELAAAAGRIHAALVQGLSPVLGQAGVHALFARSVKLARVDFPCLEEVVSVAGSADVHAPVAGALVACLSRLKPAAGWEVATSLYATLLGLMTRLIGKSLVRQLLKRAFPAMVQTGPQEKT